MNSKTKKTKVNIRTIIEISFIILVVAITLFADDLFPGSQIATLINRSLGRFFNINSLISGNVMLLLETGAILIFIFILKRIVVDYLMSFIVKKVKKAKTGLSLLKGLLKYVIYGAGLVLILTSWGVEPTIIYAVVGLLGVAVSFGAQSLIEDVISGLFILLDKPFDVGDWVLLDGFRGEVVDIGLRVTHVREKDTENVLVINNRDIRSPINASVNLSEVECNVGVAYDTDIEKLEKIINANFDYIYKHAPLIKAGLAYEGIYEFADSAIMIRVVGKCEEKWIDEALNELNREVKLLLDRNGFNIPFPQIVVSYNTPTETKKSR
jgi:moderate conductance mechanosensitive channel